MAPRRRRPTGAWPTAPLKESRMGKRHHSTPVFVLVAAAILSLLTLASSASAECAWVVWRQTLSDSPAVPASGNWIPEAAFKTQEECIRDIKQKHAAYFGNAKLEGYTYTRGAYCLPDTVDPRGPKGR